MSAKLEDEFTVRRLTPQDFDAAVDFVHKHYTPVEPIRAMITKDVEQLFELDRKRVRDKLEQPTCFGVFHKSGAMVASGYCSVDTRRTEISHRPELNFSSWYNDLYAFVCLLEGDLMDELDTDRFLMVSMLAVDAAHQRRGFAELLVRKSEEAAVRLGCNYVVADASSFFSQALFEKLGYLKLKEVKYADHFESLQLKPNPPHLSCAIYYKKCYLGGD